ncbi:NUDIX hydrolase [Paraliomyxa miuraensis]|uniref:NUDIX hydrolase n=1 Tax=Paraliomyxa miuraensis TaxID=376150 RepID=UPI00225AADAA|nr:CoA pyrophosphatase [Paraliomyxa miuraensis]MCX4246203.1 CoA pyrophosphatase [Paraliomyxa miuraensis]
MSRPVALPDDLARRLDDPAGAVPKPVGLRWAAVIGLLLRDAEDDPDPRLLFIERSRALRAHGGQVAFPGGKPEPHDATLLDTALREAAEEVDLPPSGTTVLGRLRPVPTPTGFLIMPFVAWAPLSWTPRAASPEVHRLVMPRLRELADPSIHRVAGQRMWRGHPYDLHEYAVHDPPVWGATAHMVRDLLLRLGLAEDARDST